MPISQLFEYQDFREYTRTTLNQPPFGRGSQAQLAKFLDCQPSFVSQILNGKNELSLEHAHRINLFFQHRPIESDYFLNLVLLSKAASSELIKYYQRHLERIREQAMSIDFLLNQDEIDERQVLEYYNNWNHLAIHMLVTLPEYQTRARLQKRLNISDVEYLSCVEFLTRLRLIEINEDESLRPGRNRIHLKKSSPYAKYAGSMMRLKALERLDMSSEQNMHFSAMFTVSQNVYDQLKIRLKEVILELNEKTKDDQPTQLVSLTLDLMNFMER